MVGVVRYPEPILAILEGFLCVSLVFSILLTTFALELIIYYWFLERGAVGVLSPGGSVYRKIRLCFTTEADYLNKLCLTPMQIYYFSIKICSNPNILL